VIPTATPPVSTVSTVDAGVGQNKSTVEASPTYIYHSRINHSVFLTDDQTKTILKGNDLQVNLT
jgi:hypothetical protein